MIDLLYDIGVAEKVYQLVHSTGYLHLTAGMVVMWLIAFVLIYLAIKKEFEPLLHPG